ncbi:MAG: hypothetical protein ACJ76S_06030 [Solirubrobacteraceae bacterium]
MTANQGQPRQAEDEYAELVAQVEVAVYDVPALDRLQKVIDETPLTAFQRDDLLGRVEMYRYGCIR